MAKEFVEIGHSGGKVTFDVCVDGDGHVTYQISYTHSRPVPVVMIAVWALPQGIPVEAIDMGGIGTPWNSPPVPGCLPVFISSDSEGHFGHNCIQCGGYWRSGPWPNLCPYCRTKAPSYQFLSGAQQRYVGRYCSVLAQSLEAGKKGKVVIDMDIVADAVENEGDKPDFFVSEESQQHKFVCTACEEFNDILGRFGYCSLCGTRNDLADFSTQTVPSIRNRVTSGGSPEDCVRDSIASFDSLAGQYGKQLARLVPMTQARRTRLEKRGYHDLREVRTTLKEWFDIDLYAGLNDTDGRFVELKFHRRHVYEHNGGEVDQKYLDDSGDTTVRLKQSLREPQEDCQRLLGALTKMARNLHTGFHELLPPIREPIKAFEEKKSRITQ